MGQFIITPEQREMVEHLRTDNVEAVNERRDLESRLVALCDKDDQLKVILGRRADALDVEAVVDQWKAKLHSQAISEEINRIEHVALPESGRRMAACQRGAVDVLRAVLQPVFDEAEAEAVTANAKLSDEGTARMTFRQSRWAQAFTGFIALWGSVFDSSVAQGEHLVSILDKILKGENPFKFDTK